MRGKRQPGKSTYRWDDGIKMDLYEAGWGHFMVWFGSGQGKVAGNCEPNNETSCCINFRVISWLSEDRLASKEVLCVMEWVNGWVNEWVSESKEKCVCHINYFIETHYDFFENTTKLSKIFALQVLQFWRNDVIN